MDTIQYTTIDKRDWPRGEWDNEPDKVQWSDDATGYPCLIVRGPLGALCGYVGVPEGHPAFEAKYSDVNVDTHGDLSFSDFCAHGDEEDSICHIPGPGEPDRVWWLGFDCGHNGDISPAPRFYQRELREWQTYRNLGYVQETVKQLAAQLHAQATPR